MNEIPFDVYPQDTNRPYYEEDHYIEDYEDEDFILHEAFNLE